MRCECKRPLSAGMRTLPDSLASQWFDESDEPDHFVSVSRVLFHFHVGFKVMDENDSHDIAL